MHLTFVRVVHGGSKVCVPTERMTQKMGCEQKERVLLCDTENVISTRKQ